MKPSYFFVIIWHGNRGYLFSVILLSAEGFDGKIECLSQRQTGLQIFGIHAAAAGNIHKNKRPLGPVDQDHARRSQCLM
jgi:hypothetical protein